MCKEDSPLNLARRLFWPASFALGFFIALAAIGSSNGVRPAFADEGDICKISGPQVIAEGESYLYVAVLDDSTPHTFSASTDNVTGRSRITSLLTEDEDEDNDLVYKTIPGSNLVKNIESVDLFHLPEDLVDELRLVDPGFKPRLNVCGDATSVSLKRIIADLVLLGFGSDMTAAEQAAAAAAIEALLNSDEDINCAEVALEAGKAAAGAGATSGQARDLRDAIEIVCANDFVLDTETCEKLLAPDAVTVSGKSESTADNDCDDEDESFLDTAVIVDVTCSEAGKFEITFTDESENDDALTLAVVCRGAPDGDSTIAVQPNKVEIVPALGSVSHSLVTVTLLTDGEQAAPGFEVDFTVDRCTIEVSGVDTAAEYAAARALFNSYNVNAAQTGADIEASAAATAALDTSRTQDTVVSFVNTAGDATIGAAILGCGPADTGSTVASPGIATITAVIEVEGGLDIVKTATVTIVGPPAVVTVSAQPSSLRCGEKATLTATVVDSIGQTVSEHTRVEAVTNAGGVLGGTGAVAGLAGPVVPISSTVAETFGGKATFYLLTSQQHSGPYEVVVTTGGNGAVTSTLGGVFSTPPVSAQTTVNCTIPTVAAPAAAIPAIAAPALGQGAITPPNTGDAGLARQPGDGRGLFAALLAVTCGVTALAGLRSARR